MRFVRVVLTVVLLAFSLAGCKQAEKVVKVNADGSGTIEATVLRDKELVEWTAKMAAESKTPPPAFFDEARFKAKAADMGEGVTFVSAKEIKTEKGDGFAVVYAFTDVSKVKLDPNTEDLSDVNVGSPPKQPEELITFRFARSRPAELHVLLPSPDLKPKSSFEPKELTDQMIESIREGLSTMRSTLAVAVAGTIRETNAEYHGPSRVTLNAVDFSKVTADKQRFEALLRAGAPTNRTEKAMLSGIEGVMIEIATDVKIRFQ